MTEPQIEPQFNLSTVELFGMIIARDELLERVFEAMGAAGISELWGTATRQIDAALRSNFEELSKAQPPE